VSSTLALDANASGRPVLFGPSRPGLLVGVLSEQPCQSERPFCTSALRQRGGSPIIRCMGVRVSRACMALRAALASLAVMGSRAAKGRSSQASSLCSLFVCDIGTSLGVACGDRLTICQLWLSKPFNFRSEPRIGSPTVMRLLGSLPAHHRSFPAGVPSHLEGHCGAPSLRTNQGAPTGSGQHKSVA